MSDSKSPKRNKVQVSFRFAPERIQRLKKESDKTGVTGTRIIEKALDLYFSRKA
jgi:predicted DNA-binding protein